MLGTQCLPCKTHCTKQGLCKGGPARESHACVLGDSTLILISLGGGGGKSWKTVLRIKEKWSTDFSWKRPFFNKANRVFLRMDSHGLECPPERLASWHAMVRMCSLKTLCGKQSQVWQYWGQDGDREMVRSSGCHPFEWISVNYQCAHA